ncbi:efflux RND transporter periplasmic adaptor subunit [Methylophilaceae bacterium]|nr:efflux RND transporter periplasmic adaptor subunit [Methylophilaceae bacterium]
MINNLQRFLTLIFLSYLLLGCGDNEPKKKSVKKEIYITTSKVILTKFEDKETAIGSIKGIIDPTVSAEISGSVVKLYARTGSLVIKGDLLAEIDEKNYKYELTLARAEVRRLKTRLTNQKKIYERNQKLVEKKFISSNALDAILTKKTEAFEELEVALSKRDIAQSSFEKTKIYAPISGKIEKQIPSIGDFLKIGDPVFQVVNNKKLRAHIPFPEKLVSKLKAGTPIRLKSPTSPNEITSEIAELKPKLMSDSRSIDVIADIENQLDWQPGASVKGTIVFSTRQGLAVPEQSVVLRPAGQVVYVVNEDKVEQRNVEMGINQNGVIEIISGLEQNEIVALDGAGYLTDQTKVNISAQ